MPSGFTVSWAICTPRPKAMTFFKRGISDLGYGRGRDLRYVRISWSLMPRDCCRRPLRQWRHRERNEALPDSDDLQTT
jgi:hypothetical protein